MTTLRNLLIFVGSLALLGGCSDRSQDAAPEAEAEATAPGATMTNGGIPVNAPSEEVFALYMRAQDRADMGDFIEANQLARELTEKAPEFVAAWLMLGNAAVSGEQFVKATKKAQGIKANGTPGEQIWADINMTFVDNNAEEGLRLGQKLVETYPDSPRAWLVMSGLQAGQNQHDKARESGGRAVELDPEYAAGHITLGGSYLFSEPKDLVKAETHFARLIELRPKEAYAWINLGDVHRAMNDLEKARTEYGKAMEMDPSNAVAPVKRGHVNSFLGNYDEARADYDNGIALGEELSRANLANYRAFVHLHAGDAAAAVEELKSLVESIGTMDIPNHQKISARNFTLGNLANICMHNGMTEDAQQAVGQLTANLAESGANSGDPDFARQQQANAVFWEGRLAAEKGDYATAEAKAEEYAGLLKDDQNPRKMENYHEILGLVALKQGDHEKAVEHYRQSNLQPGGFTGDVRNKYMLGLALQGAGQEEEAQALFKEVGEYNFNSVWYAMLRSDAKVRS